MEFSSGFEALRLQKVFASANNSTVDPTKTSFRNVRARIPWGAIAANTTTPGRSAVFSHVDALLP